MNKILITIFTMTFLIQAGELNWWEQFNDPELNKIIEEGMSENRTLMNIASKVDQSEEYSKIIRSQLLPSLYGNLRVGKANLGDFPSFESDSVFTTASATLDARYKLDAWGEELQQYRASRLSGKAAEVDYKKTEMTISKMIGSLYFDVVTAKKQLQILISQRDNSELMLKLASSKYKSGISTGYALLQQKQQLASIEAAIPPAKMAYENTLLYLSAVTFIDVENLRGRLPIDLPILPIREKSTVNIETNYDLRGAKLREASSKATFTKTKLSIVPSIDLTGSIGYSYSDANFTNPVGGWSDTWQIGAAVTLPIYTGGAIMAGLKERRAAYKGAVATREQAEKDAYKSSKTAEIQESLFKEQVVAYENQLSASKALYQEALNQYKLGLISYSEVLMSLNSYQQGEIILLTSKKNLLNARLSVIEAAGGK